MPPAAAWAAENVLTPFWTWHWMADSRIGSFLRPTWQTFRARFRRPDGTLGSKSGFISEKAAVRVTFDGARYPA